MEGMRFELTTSSSSPFDDATYEGINPLTFVLGKR